MFRRDKGGGVRSEQILNSFTCSLAVRSLLRRCGWPRGMALLESSCSRTQWTTAMGTMPRCTQTTGGCPTPAPREGPPLWVKAIPSPQATPLQVGLLRKSLLESEVFQNTCIAVDYSKLRMIFLYTKYCEDHSSIRYSVKSALLDGQSQRHETCNCRYRI